MAGFAGLLVAGHLGLQSIANLAILGITVCMLVSLTALPATLGWLERHVSGTGFGVLPAHHVSPDSAS